MAAYTIPILAVLVMIVVVYRYWYSNQKVLPPGVRPLPGPKGTWLLPSIPTLLHVSDRASPGTGLPFIGRVHDVPSTATWLKFWEWSQVYGPIYQMEIFGSVHVWISTEQIANDLMAKRGSVYSDRPKIPNLPDNRTSGDYLPLLGRNGQYSCRKSLLQS